MPTQTTELVIDQTTMHVHSIEMGNLPGHFLVHRKPERLGGPGGTREVSGKVLGDALRARFDLLEARVECGELEYVTVGPEMDEIATILMREKI